MNYIRLFECLFYIFRLPEKHFFDIIHYLLFNFVMCFMFSFSKWAVVVFSAFMALPVMAANLQLRIIETSDVHAHLTDFDYNQNQTNPKIGLTRAANLIKQARREVKNSVYVDNGDVLQGSMLGDYMAAKGLAENEKHPSYLALEKLNATASVVGSHEFNYGLDYLNRAIANTSVPILSANVFDAKTKAPYFKPYLFKIMMLKDEQGQKHRVNVAFIGFTPPQVLQWDKRYLDGKILVSDIVLTAKKYVPLLKYLGADVIIALNHSGLGDGKTDINQENTTLALSKIEGIDAIAFGHEHDLFPSENFARVAGVDVNQGTLNQAAATMPGQFANHIGVIDLILNNDSGKWRVINKSAQLRPIFDEKTQKPLVSNNWRLKWAMRPYEKATRKFVAQPVGNGAAPMANYLSLVQDDPTIQLINNAQTDYVQRELAGLPELAKLPILSAAAPLRAGGRHNDPTAYTDISQGNLTYRDVVNLYPSPSTVAAVKVNGAELKEWLECSASVFQHLQSGSSDVQPLVNWAGFHTYNFDVIDGVSYQIDVSKPARYNGDCLLVNPKSQRIRQLTFNGKPVHPQAEFIVATNNYRAFGGKFAGTGKNKVVLDSSVENRQVISHYIYTQTEQNGAVIAQADQNWRFAPVAANAYFETSPTERAKNYIEQNAARPYIWSGTDGQGFAMYQFDMQK